MNDFKIVKNIKLFIYSIDNIVINIPNKDRVIKERLYNTSYDILYLVYRCNYKINNGKVGFPLNTINKVINILENNSVSYIVKENMEDVNKKMHGNKGYYFEEIKKWTEKNGN